MVFIELPIFIRCAERLFTEEDLYSLQATLLLNPCVGDLITQGAGLRKLRVPLAGRGKRAGARVIYYFWRTQVRCYMVYAYAKNETENVTQSQLRALGDLMKEILKNERPTI